MLLDRFAGYTQGYTPMRFRFGYLGPRYLESSPRPAPGITPPRPFAGKDAADYGIPDFFRSPRSVILAFEQGLSWDREKN